jgi:hypothetical protein
MRPTDRRFADALRTTSVPTPYDVVGRAVKTDPERRDHGDEVATVEGLEITFPTRPMS